MLVAFFYKKFERQCPTRSCEMAPSLATLNIATQIQRDSDDTPFKLLCWFANF
jgi:hypothetical protein